MQTLWKVRALMLALTARTLPSAMISTNAKLGDRTDKDAVRNGQYAASERQGGQAKSEFKQPFVERNVSPSQNAANHGKFGPTGIGGPSA